MLRSLGRLYTQGRAVNWDGVLRGTPAKQRATARVPAWQRERHWSASASVDGERAGHTAR